MVKCDYCDDEVDYLPFRCRYCGKSYCKKHRIPENHECSFEFKNDPYKMKSRDEAKPTKIYTDYPAESQPAPQSSRRTRIRMPRTRDRINRTRPQVTSLLGMQTKPYGTYGLMMANVVFFFFAFILESISVDLSQYLLVSISDFIDGFRYWTFLTAIFIPTYPSLFGIFYLLLDILMLFLIGRMLEARWGWKMLVKIYILSGLFTSAGILLIQWGSSLIYPVLTQFNFYSSWGAYIGMIAFIALLFPQQQVTMYMYFIPIRIKMKNLIWLFLGISGIFGVFNVVAILGGFNSTISFPQNFGNMVGALGGLILNRAMRRNS